MIQFTIHVSTDNQGGVGASYHVNADGASDLEWKGLSLFLCPRAEEIARKLSEISIGHDQKPDNRQK